MRFDDGAPEAESGSVRFEPKLTPPPEDRLINLTRS